MAEPVLETYLTELRTIIGNESPLGQFRAEVARTRIHDDFARIVLSAEPLTYELVESEALGPGDFTDVIHWRANRDPADAARDIVGRHRLNEHGCETDLIAIGRGRGN